MKLATYKDGSRDGQLLLVSRDLSTAHYATGIANHLQQVLDDWNFYSPQLQDLSDALNSGKARHAFPFDPLQCLAPLPRAYQWASGAAYNRQAGEPLMHQGGGDVLLGPCDDVVCASEADGIDFEAQLAVITGDVRMGATPDQALESIRLVMLANAVSLRHLMAAEQAQGAGLIQSKPATAFSPVAVTPDELGAAWQGGRVELNLKVSFNGKQVGLCDTGSGMSFHFGQLIAQQARTRGLRAGTIIGSGAVSDPEHGYCSIADQRALETRIDVNAVTPWMKFGDSIRIEMKERDGGNLFGAIDQDLLPLLESAQ